MTSAVGRDSDDFPSMEETEEENQNAGMRKRPGRPRKYSQSRINVQNNQNRRGPGRQRKNQSRQLIRKQSRSGTNKRDNRGAGIGHPFYGNQWTTRYRQISKENKLNNENQLKRRPGRPKNKV